MSKKITNNIYFISDVHLAFAEDDREREKRKKLLEFLQTISSDAKELYILGDLFDFWFEWYHVIPRYWCSILYQLRSMSGSGIVINFITGNHDFYTGSYLEKEIGLHCFDSSREFSAGGKRFFVAHGDGFARQDRGYRLMKKIIRNPVSQFCYKTFIPADLGMQLAKWASYSSRKCVKINKAQWSQEYYEFARQKLSEGFDYVLLGHLHAPMIKEEEGKVYINCGDWLSWSSFAKYDGQSLTLHYWSKSL